MDKPVVTTPDTYRLSKISAKIIEMVRRELEKKLRDRTPKARRKWEEPVDAAGARYAAECKENSEVVEIRKVRQI